MLNRWAAWSMLTIAAAATLAATWWATAPAVTRAGGPTNVSGIISSDTTWTLADSPYVVTGNVLVSQGVTLTIEPGVTVKFDSGKSLQVNGTFIARGTGSKPITFTSNRATPAAGDWGYIFFTDSSSDASYAGDGSYLSGSILEHAVIEYGGLLGVPAAYTDKASPFINYTTIKNNSGAGISISANGTVKLTNNAISNNSSGIRATGDLILLTSNTISNNAGGGVEVRGGEGIISDNTIEDNGGDGILAANEGTITITDNTIQDNGGSGIIAANKGASMITDNTIKSNKGSGIYRGPLSFGGVGGPASISGNSVVENRTQWAPPSQPIPTCNYQICHYGVGVLILGARGAVSITNNFMARNDSYGIQASGGSLAVTGNIVSGGVSISFGDPLTVTGNIVSGGVSISYSGPLTVTRNVIADGGLTSTSGNTTTTIELNQLVRSWMRISEGTAVVSVETNTLSGDIGYASASGVYWKADSSASSASAFANNNLLFNTRGYLLYSDRPNNAVNLNAKNNWWGTTSESDIQARIYDWNDDFTKGIVDYSPYLTSPDTSAPISPPTGLAVAIAPGTISLSWAANPESDTAGYNIYYDTDSGYPYTGTGAFQGSSPIDVGNVTSYRLTGLAAGTYYVAIMAYDTSRDGTNDQTDGNESWFSEEVTALKVYLPLVASGYVGGW